MVCAERNNLIRGYPLSLVGIGRSGLRGALASLYEIVAYLEARLLISRGPPLKQINLDFPRTDYVPRTEGLAKRAGKDF